MTPRTIAARTDLSFDNAIVGEGTLIEPDVHVGWRYHRTCGPAIIGCNGMLRKGTLIYGDVTAGDYFQTGHYAIVRAKVTMGNHCALGHHSTLEGVIEMGDGVRIMSHVYIPSRTRIGHHVFIGPGVTFLNDKRPARTDPMPTPVGATIEDDVVIGGGCTILPGVTIGAGSFVAAGCVVTGNVPPRRLVMGVPGRFHDLPPELDRLNHRGFTQPRIDLWHPDTSDLAAIDWPRADE